MAKLKLTANPTFKAKVPVPIAGDAAVDVEMTFKHRTKAALDKWISSAEGRSDVASFMDMVEGWELEDEFNEANVVLLLENYIGVGVAVLRTYVEQLVQAKAKNSAPSP